jgi:uncharacterized protein (DUF2267 family)
VKGPRLDPIVASNMNDRMETMEAIRLSRRLDLTIRELDGVLVILDRLDFRVHQLILTASCIWEACDGSTTPAELVEVVTRTFDVDPNTAAEDVAATVAQLLKLRLLEP